MLKALYSLFVGMLLAAFIAVGIDAFYPRPAVPQYPTSLQLPITKSEGAPTDDQLDAQREYDRLYADYRVESTLYNRNVSIVVLVAAVVFVVTGLTFDRRVRLMADGVLLGGIFSLLYSIGRSFAAGSSKYTLAVVGVGLVLTVAIGYVRFLRPADHRLVTKAKAASRPTTRRTAGGKR